jgi:hypothetical protein
MTFDSSLSMNETEIRCSRFAILPESIQVGRVPRDCAVYAVQSPLRGPQVFDSLVTAFKALGYDPVGYTESEIDTVGVVLEFHLRRRVRKAIRHADTTYGWKSLHVTAVVINRTLVTLGIVVDHPLDRQKAYATMSRTLNARGRLLGGSVAYGGLDARPNEE